VGLHRVRDILIYRRFYAKDSRGADHNMSGARILCIHQNRLYRQCLVWVLRQDERFADYEIVDLDHELPDLASRLAGSQPNVLLIDISLGQMAVDLTKLARRELNARVVMLIAQTANQERSAAILLDCVEAGAQGYVLEEKSLDELGSAVINVTENRAYWSAPLLELIMANLIQARREARWRRRSSVVDLTDREQEILQWIADGLSNKEVARKLSLSLYTVKNHVSNIISKLNATNRKDAVRRALDAQALSAN
jgi:two-component system nitrate/nitrite response regulator NarL